MLSAEETNKDLVRRFFEALAQRDLDALEEMMVPDFVNHTKYDAWPALARPPPSTRAGPGPRISD